MKKNAPNCVRFALIRISSQSSSQTIASPGQTIANYYKFSSRLRLGTIALFTVNFAHLNYNEI